jgi:hypothetical protein
MVDYVEFPTDLVRRIVLPKKPDDGGGGDDGGGHFCGSYGYGAITAFVTPGLISDVPYGPSLAEPFVGPIHFGDQVVAQAAPYGQAAEGLALNLSGIDFTTPQTRELSHTIPGMSERFTANLVVGYETLGYQLDFAWFSSATITVELPGQPLYGLDFQNAEHPELPFTPRIIMGTAIGEGGFSYFYDFKSKGPAVVWWRWNDYPIFTELWIPTGLYAGHNLFEGDWYTWQITAVCG